MYKNGCYKFRTGPQQDPASEIYSDTPASRQNCCFELTQKTKERRREEEERRERERKRERKSVKERILHHQNMFGAQSDRIKSCNRQEETRTAQTREGNPFFLTKKSRN